MRPWNQAIALLVSFVQVSQYYVYGALEFFIMSYVIEVAKLDAFYAGLILTMEAVTIIISRPVLGRLSDKKGRRIPIISSTNRFPAAICSSIYNTITSVTSLCSRL
jgi:MFS family permease